MSENESEKPYVDPNSGAAPQPGGFTAAPVARDESADSGTTEESTEESEPQGEYSELLSGKVEDVQKHIDKNPDQKDAIVAAEKDGQNRKGIVEY